MGKRRMPDLYRAPFPLYSIKVDPKTGLVITAGGGGASKTGIKNAVQFLDLQLDGGHQYNASLLHSHDTDTRATMNMAIGNGVIAAGQDGTCSLMKFKHCTPKEEGKAAAEDAENSMQRGNARHRGGKRDKGGRDEAAASGDMSPMKDETAHISVTRLAEVQSDLNPKDPLQKVVRFSPDLSLLLTGGTDGHIRVWEFPSLKKKFDFKAHEVEIEDLDMSPGNKHLVTVGRDFSCSVWSGSQLAMGLKWLETMPQIAEKIYRYMACRFGKVADQKGALRLYTVQIPHKRVRKPPPCYLTKWDGKSFLPMLTAPCGTEVISSLAVSDCGTFIGLGTVTGSVAIYIAFSLQKLYYVQESHGIVVTDLAFLPDSLKGKNIKGNNETAMLSVAVDSRCQVHAVPNRRSFPIWLVLFFCGLMVVGVVLLLQYLFPGFI
ncbi:guanine nucleotide-exchange factor SEC12 isoform X1 [Etheostoma spectabile]|uniref:prolactin regulatory element-binding protein isoform X1 n=1 Tax=Etheostoma spectabile TaxID=54343 RepID=UPI0013AF6606|nr:prolactin regulatory element-binding protein-like isoform X1 [Etheostoma spectabile]XP_032367330.1 prolactin regulatory element-binding protein-like isoform X1 [Etheostoma spectabile]XP_032367331.1 prolactin regulatory element-binding protein-like isoform X1 [Etheostoma spectabile]XP_032367332.1 prolactin regulatory element-binding protein-like isoform X1 [Etheostoma spectabile]XP_032387878.1 prolactin regulatory element-binding protein-like isoform X1 [Etheostoma spectabile]XP_032387880.1 